MTLHLPHMINCRLLRPHTVCQYGNTSTTHEKLSSLTVPSGPPTDVQAEPGGRGSVRVNWTAPDSGASGYVIVYRPSSAPSNQTMSVQVDTEATSYVIESVMTETEYTVQVLAYLELPTSLSSSATVYLDGKSKCAAEHILHPVYF